jgi:hypothetical protein
MPRGGKREGAGGKPIDGVKRCPVTAALSANIKALLDAAAGVSGRSRSMLLNDAAEAYAESLRAIAQGTITVEPSVIPKGNGGYRPGSGRRNRRT